MFTHLLTSKTLRTLAVLTTVVVPGAAFATDPLPPVTPPAQRAKPVAISDVALARAVLTAFDADPVLKNANILVSVVDRGALIGGPVSTEDLKKRAEAVVRAVPGIASVKNTCFVDADPDPLLRAVADRMKPGAKPTRGAALPGVAIPPGAADGFIPPVPAAPPSDLVVVAPDKTVVARPPNLLGAPVIGVLGAPVMPGPVAKAQPTAPSAPSPAPGALTGFTGGKPQDALAALCATDARFAKLKVELKPDGVLFVTGSVEKAADVWAFAAQARKVPGVARVAVDPDLVK